MARAGTIRVHEYMAAAATRLASARMNSLLGGSGRVKLFGRDTFENPEGAENQPWGRLVVKATDTPIEISEDRYGLVTVGFIVRAEFNDYEAPGYWVQQPMEAVQEEAYLLLEGWMPTGLAKMLVAQATYRYTAPQRVPQWDEGRGLWWNSSQYRFQAAPTS